VADYLRATRTTSAFASGIRHPASGIRHPRRGSCSWGPSGTRRPLRRSGSSRWSASPVCRAVPRRTDCPAARRPPSRARRRTHPGDRSRHRRSGAAPARRGRPPGTAGPEPDDRVTGHGRRRQQADAWSCPARFPGPHGAATAPDGRSRRNAPRHLKCRGRPDAASPTASERPASDYDSRGCLRVSCSDRDLSVRPLRPPGAAR
jgi:hypothetical protein